MGGSGFITDMINRNKANRALSKSRYRKFDKNKPTLSSPVKEEEGFRFKTPDPAEVKALRMRLAEERSIERRNLWIATAPVWHTSTVCCRSCHS